MKLLVVTTFFAFIFLVHADFTDPRDRSFRRRVRPEVDRRPLARGETRIQDNCDECFPERQEIREPSYEMRRQPVVEYDSWEDWEEPAPRLRQNNVEPRRRIIDDSFNRKSHREIDWTDTRGYYDMDTNDFGQDDYYNSYEYEDSYNQRSHNGYGEEDNFYDDYNEEEEVYSNNANAQVDYWNSYELEDNTYDSKPENYPVRDTQTSSGRQMPNGRVRA